MQIIDSSLQGLEIQATEPAESSSASGGKSDKFTLEDRNDILGGKRAFHGSITSKSSTELSKAMPANSTKENKGVSKGGSHAGSNGLAGGVALVNNANKTIGEDDKRPFFTAYDNEGHAYLQAEYHSDEEKSVSEFTDVSRGGWGKIKVT